MTDTTNNPRGAGYGNYITNGAVLQQYVAYQDLPIGALVEIAAYNGPGDTSPPSVPYVALGSIAADGMTIGVVVAGDITGSQTVKAGGVAVVLVRGIAQVLCDSTVTYAQFLENSNDNYGCGQSTAFPTFPVAGMVLESVTVDAGPLPAWCFINPGTQPTYQGPYLLDTDDGHTYRIISTDGVLSTTEVA